MNKTLNVSIVQMPIGTTEENLRYLKRAVDDLMTGYVRPELVVGVEFGLGLEPQTIPGPVTRFLSALARRHHIYLIPGTLAEAAPELPEGAYYNTCPVFGPDGQLIRAYRKRVPFWPAEPSVPGQDEGCFVFHIPEKDVKVGLLICYEQFFPEIPRTLALEGADLLVCPSLDGVDFAHIPDILPRARALENEAFYIWTNSAGAGTCATYCGKSTIVDPEGNIIHQCGTAPELVTKTLELARAREKRILGADQHLASLRRFQVAYPYAGQLNSAPVYQDMPPLTETPAQYETRLREMGRGTLSHVELLEDQTRQAEQLMNDILNAF